MIAMLRPIAPFVEYVINYDYISKVLCINKDKPVLSCNGKCQLMKKLEKLQQDDFKSLRIQIEKYPIGFVYILKLKETTTYTLLKKNKLFSHSQNYHFLFNKDVFHPPTV